MIIYFLTDMMCIIFFWIFFTGCITQANFLNNVDEPIVKTSTGIVVGKYTNILNTDVSTFLGIPFAKSPTGEKRFTKPEPIDKWDGKLFAKTKSPSCMQFSSKVTDWIPIHLNKSEDCLFLNIWVPKKDINNDDQLPVMIWIHGGGFATGSANLDLYDGDIVAVRGKVIVASMNYRVGLFGFLNGGISEAPGNVGLLDQLEALKWLKKNIRKFGGDPENITLFGESAGAISVALHIASPLSKNLFQRAIMESGTTYMSSMTEEPENSVQRANNFAESASCSNKQENLMNNPFKVINCLKNKNALELAKVEDDFTAVFPAYFLPYFGTKCDGCNEFLPESPIELVETGRIAQVPVLLGSNLNEGAAFINYMMPDIFPSDREPNLNLAQARHIIESIFVSKTKLAPQIIFDFYFQNIKENDSEEIVKTISNTLGDFMFNCPTLYFAEKSKEAYLYWMNHISSKKTNTKWLDATHFYDVQYVFGKPLIEKDKFSPDDVTFSSSLIDKWASFSRNGFPSTKDNEQLWTKFDSDNPLAYELNFNGKGMLAPPRKVACEFWRPYIKSS